MNISTERQVGLENVGPAVELINPEAPSPVLLICEHASNFFPSYFGALGLTNDVQLSHIAWDPGALAVTQHLAKHLEASAIVGRISRLIYDCNRPPEAIDAVPERSEIFDVPGNKGLSAEQYQERVEACFEPFSSLLDRTIKWSKTPRVLVTVHSFTPVYRGVQRETEIGILHDSDSRLADAMLALAPELSDLKIDRNKPYGPQDGVTYTLKKHGVENGLLNVMIEIRNDLLATPEQQAEIADLLGQLISRSLASLEEGEAC